MKNIFHHSSAFIAKHKHHHHLALATLALVLAGASVYTYRNDLAQAATYTWTQTSWATLEPGATASHQNQVVSGTAWTKYASKTASTTASGSGVGLELTSYTFTDDLATSTSPTPGVYVSGGGFANVTHSNTIATSSGASIELGRIDGGDGSEGAYSCTSTCDLASGTHNYTTFNISSGATVNLTGTAPFILRATGAVTIAGTLNAIGSITYLAAAGGYNGAYGAPAISAQGAGAGAGGGAGGGYGGAGGNNGDGNAGGPANTSSMGGGGHGGVRTSNFRSGGASGGYVKIVSSGQIAVTSSGVINAYGLAGDNGPSDYYIAGGGGSGGHVHLAANEVVVNGGLIASGGAGGSNLNSAGGGGGGGGRVYLYYLTSLDTTGANINVTGGTGGTGGTTGGGTGGDGPATVTGISPYNTTGTSTSGVIDLGPTVDFTSLSFSSTTPAGVQTSCVAGSGTGCAIKIQIATSSSSSGPWNFKGPNGSASTYFTMGHGTTGTNITTSAFNGAQYVKYQAVLSTSNTANTPLLDSVSIGYTQYPTSGELISSKYNSGDTANTFSTISWSATNANVSFQVRTSATEGGLDTADWCGPANCSGSNYFTTSGESATGNTGLTDHINDQWIQYRTVLSSDGATPVTVSSVTVQYVINAPPEIQSVSAVQNADGIVSVSYQVRDIDSAVTGSVTPNAVAVTLQYCTTGSCVVGSDTGWANASAVTGFDSAPDVVNGLENGYGSETTGWTSKTLTWTPASEAYYVANPTYNATQKIRIKAFDGEGANNLGYAVPASSFVMDAKVPVVSYVRIDSSATNNPVTWSVADDTTLSYRLSNTAFASLTSNEVEWTTVGASTGIDWPTLVGTPSAETVYYQFKDAYGNGVSSTVVAPALPVNFASTDTSNTQIEVFREFLSWGLADASTFGSYKVYYSTSGVGGVYNLADAGTISTRTQNYYVHNITTATTLTHYYKVATVSTNGDVSEFTSVKSDVPDGSGSADTTAPYIPSLGIAVSSIGNTSAKITFSTYTDISIAEGELATSTVKYGTYTGDVPSTCPSTFVSTDTYIVNHEVYLTGLTPSSNYYFCVIAKDVAGNVSTLTTATGDVFETVGGPRITGVTEREVTDISATIFWNTDTSSDSKVYYADSVVGMSSPTLASESIVTTAGTNENGTFYQHQIGLTGLTAGVTYYYKVTSTDSLATPNTSTDDRTGQYYSFVTLKDTTPPTISGIATPVVSSSASVVVWMTDEPATSQVLYGTETGSRSKFIAVDETKSIYHVATLSSATTNVGAGGGTNVLTASTPYYYVVKSIDVAGNVATSDEQTVTTNATGDVTIVAVSVINRITNPETGAVADTTAPTVSNIEVSGITPFGATVKFDTSEDAVSFVDYGRDALYGDSAGNKTHSKTHTIKLRGLTLGTEYHINVSAVDKAGNTGTSPDQTFKTTFLSENLADMTNVENIEQFQKEIEAAIESILPSLVPPFISKPTVTDITESEATITFKTNIKAFPVVGYAEDGEFDGAKDNPYSGEASDTETRGTEHSLRITGLNSNTKYHYQARAFSLPKVIGKSADLTFITKAAKIQGSIVERKRDSFTVVWVTDEPTSSIVEYRNVKAGTTERKVDEAKRTSHSMKIENLPSGTTYLVDISGLNEQGNVVEAGDSISVTTSTDVTDPIITGFKVDNALVPNRTDLIQTIVSWTTDEPSNGVVYNEEGAGSPDDTKELANKTEVLDSYTTNHSIVLPNLKPGKIYRIKVTSSDDSGNMGSFGPRTIITPRQTESITDIIFKNFEDSFKFLQKI